ncbi:MAG TPA: cytochrome c maturation protein CcmE [Candidatus Binataceae bacterium]|jgi:cytochrome c-type biogenesis protein CcmE|nr:cytochrome c maturation protein CcmE [Candidatus Binataceae bacterium]
MPKRLRFALGGGLIIAAIGYLIVTAVRNTAEYYLTVDEVKVRQGELAGQSLRVAGRVAPQAISWDPVSLTLSFGLAQPPPAVEAGVKPVAVSVGGATIFHVICRGQPKPDMFAANRDVIVEGRLAADGTIEARQVLTSCPSKYVPKQPAAAP